MFHIVNIKSLLKSLPLPAGGCIFKKKNVPALGHCSAGQENTRTSYTLNIKMQRKAWNSVWKESQCWQTTPSGEAAAKLSLVNTALLFLLIQLRLPTILFFFILTLFLSSTHTSYTQTICLFSHIHSLLHISLLFYINLTLPLLSSLSFSLPCLLLCFLPRLLRFPL